MAAELGDALGRVLEVVDLPPEGYRARLEAAGLPPGFVDTAVNGARLVAAGGNAVLTDEVERVLGRAPRTFTGWARDHLEAFGG